MRLVANTIKHGEGGSDETLKVVHPELFTNPAYTELYDDTGVTLEEWVSGRPPIYSPRSPVTTSS